MSRIGKKPIPLPAGVKVNWQDGTLSVNGPKGNLSRTLPPRINLEVGKGEILVKPEDEARQTRAFWGLTRTLVANMVIGVSNGFTRVLELVGTGYKAESKGQTVVFSLGYSHPIEFRLPKGISATVEKATRIELSGFDKEQLGEIAATMKRLRFPDAYKGKGIRFAGEVLRRKVGKAGGR